MLYGNPVPPIHPSSPARDSLRSLSRSLPRRIRNKSGYMIGIIRRANPVFDPDAHQDAVAALPASIQQKLQKMYDSNVILPGVLDTKVGLPMPPFACHLSLSSLLSLSLLPLPPLLPPPSLALELLTAFNF